MKIYAKRGWVFGGLPDWLGTPSMGRLHVVPDRACRANEDVGLALEFKRGTILELIKKEGAV